jgi:RecA/RadA recombinase
MSKSIYDTAREELQRRCGKDKDVHVGTIDTHFSAVEKWLDTGIPELNWAIAGSSERGIPFGRIVTIDGAEQSGKTALGYYLLGQALNQGALPILIETESAIDADFAAMNSLNINDTIVIGMSEKPVLDKVFATIAEAINTAAEKGLPAVLVLDSLPACLPNDDDVMKGYDGTRAAQKIRGILSRLLSNIATNDFLLVLINHLIQDPTSLHPRSIPRGGTGLRYYTSMRLTLDMKEYLKKNKLDKEEYPYGVIIEGLVNKTRFTSPRRKAKFQITFDKGVDIPMSVFLQLKRSGIIEVKGSWHYMNKEKFHLSDWYTIYKNDSGIKELAYDQYKQDPDAETEESDEVDEVDATE